GSITTAKLADNAVTAPKLADTAVTSAKIAGAAVTSSKIADANVTSTKLADLAVTTAKIANFAVTPIKTAQQPAARVRRTSAQNIGTIVYTPIAWQATRFDNDGMFSTGTPTRLTINTTGIWLIMANVGFEETSGTAGAGIRVLRLRVNGSTILAAVNLRPSSSSASGDDQNVSAGVVSTVTVLNAGDYVECLAYHNVSGGINLAVRGNYSPEFLAVRLATFTG
ncbi:MAG: hypothetical protein ACK4K6_17270, partial [Pseudarthrobacter sp.]